MRKPIILLSGSLAIIAIATSVERAFAAPHHATSRLPASRAHNKVSRPLVAHFALLRDLRTRSRARGADVSDQNALAVAIADYTPPPYAPGEPRGFRYAHWVHGLDISRAGETTIGPGQTPVWVVPGSNGACLVNLEDRAEGEIAGLSCSKTRDVEAGLLWTNDAVPYGVGGAITRVLIGAAPDGNSSVTVNWSDGTHTVVPVKDSLYSIPLGPHTGWASVSLKNSSGQTTSVPGMPQLP